MQAQNRKKQAPKVRGTREERVEKRHRGIMTMFHMIATAFSLGSLEDKQRAERKASHIAFIGGGNPEFHPRKHTVCSPSQQQRQAQKRRNIQKHPSGC